MREGLLALALLAVAPVAGAEALHPTAVPNGQVVLRLEDGWTTLSKADAPGFLKNEWYGGDMKDGIFLVYSARAGLSGHLNPSLSYGVRLLFRNFKPPAFSFPSFEPGMGNSAVVADQFFLSSTPVGETVQVILGKGPNPWVGNPNFFWDVDVQPVGASEIIKKTVVTAGPTHTFKLVAGQWFPLANLRGNATAELFVEQGAYTLENGWVKLETAAGVMKFDGFDRFVQNANTGGATTPTLNSAGTAITNTPKLDYLAENDPEVVGHDPLWGDAMLNATFKRVGGRPLALRLEADHNLMPAGPDGSQGKFVGPIGRNGLLAGATYGKVTSAYTWALGYNYQWKGVASVVNGWTDDGWGSDLAGHLVQADFSPVEGATLTVMWRYLQDADGRDKSGAALKPLHADARYQNLRVQIGANF